MGARSYRDLDAWQLANDLRQQILAFLAREPAARNFRFCQGIGDAAGSVCRNIAEGFGRFRHPEFAQFVRIALGSLHETQDQLEEALYRGYIQRPQFEQLWRLSERVRQTLGKLLAHLARTPDAQGRKGRSPARHP